MPELRQTWEATDEQLEAGQGDLKRRALQSYRRHVLDNYQRMADLRDEGARLQRFCSPVSNGQWDERIRPIFQQLGIPEKGINETWPAVHAATGREKTDRFQPKFTGRDPSDQRFADAVNATVRRDRDRAEFKYEDSKTFHQAMVQRANGLEIWVDTYTSREPRFECRRIPLNELMLDFYADKINLRDRTAISRGQWMDYREFKRQYADQSSTWERLVSEAESGSADYESGDIWHSSVGREGLSSAYYMRRRREVFVVKHEWKERARIIQLDLPGEVTALYQQTAGQPLPMELPSDVEFFSYLADLVVFAEQQRQQMIEQVRLQAEQAGQPPPEAPPVAPMIWREVDSRQLMLFKSAMIQRTGQDYNAYYELRPEVVYQAIMVGNYVLRAAETRDRNWSLFPLVPFLDDAPDVAVPYGYVDIIQPRQEWLNQFLALWIHTMAHMPKARMGVDLDKTDADEVARLNQDIARGDTVLGLHGGEDAIFDIPSGRMPDGIQEAWQIIFELVPGAAGQSRYSIGSVQDLRRTAARAVEQQLSATSATLAEAYDALALHRSATAKKMASLAFHYYTPEQFASLAGEYADAIPFDRSLWFRALDYDVNVGEEIATKDMALSALEYLNQTGMWQWVQQVAPKSLANILAPVVGSSVRDELVENLKLQEPGMMIAKLEEMLGLEEGQLQAAVEQMQQSQEAA